MPSQSSRERPRQDLASKSRNAVGVVMSGRTIWITDEDYKILKKKAEDDGRTMTETLHRLLMDS